MFTCVNVLNHGRIRVQLCFSWQKSQINASVLLWRGRNCLLTLMRTLKREMCPTKTAPTRWRMTASWWMEMYVHPHLCTFSWHGASSCLCAFLTSCSPLFSLSFLLTTSRWLLLQWKVGYLQRSHLVMCHLYPSCLEEVTAFGLRETLRESGSAFSHEIKQNASREHHSFLRTLQ